MRRASMTSLSSVDADRLIVDVQNRPAIWNRRDEGNKNKAFIEVRNFGFTLSAISSSKLLKKRFTWLYL